MPLFRVPISLVVEVEAPNQQAAYRLAMDVYIEKRGLRIAGRLLDAELTKEAQTGEFVGVYAHNMSSRIKRELPVETVISVYLTPKEAYQIEMDEMHTRRRQSHPHRGDPGTDTGYIGGLPGQEDEDKA